jgi:hypothetical protein
LPDVCCICEGTVFDSVYNCLRKNDFEELSSFYLLNND